MTDKAAKTVPVGHHTLSCSVMQTKLKPQAVLQDFALGSPVETGTRLGNRRLRTNVSYIRARGVEELNKSGKIQGELECGGA